jgi:hypothetical protein
MRAPPDERARPPGRRAKGVARSGAAKPQIAASITDLGDWRRRRGRRVHDWPQKPCTGICMCWGAPLGGWQP